MPSRGRIVFPGAALFIGLIGLFQVIERPRFQAYHAVDVVQLVGCGVCFGVTLMWLILWLRGKLPA